MADLRADLFRVGWDEIDEQVASTHSQTREVIAHANRVAAHPHVQYAGEYDQRLKLLTSLAIMQQSLIECLMQRILAMRMEPPPGTE